MRTHQINNIYLAFIIFCSFVFLSIYTYGQKSISSDSISDSQKINHYIFSIDYLSLSFLYEKRIKNNWYTGISVLGGLSHRIILGKSIKEIDYQSGDFYNGYVSKLFEIASLKVGISNYLSKIFTQNFGFYGSIVTPGEGNKYFASGLEYSIFYGFKKIKIGQRFQLGVVFMKFPGHYEANYNAIYGSVTPIIFQLTF